MTIDLLVVTPTLGKRKSVCRTIESVIGLNLGSRLLHVIVGPLDSISWIKLKYPNVIIFGETKSGGVYTALNEVLRSKYSETELFCYINDDDVFLPDFRKLFEKLYRSNNLDFCYGRTIFTKNHKYHSKGSFFPFYRAYSILLNNNIPLFTQQSLVLRTQCIINSGYFDESSPLSADSLMWNSIIAKGAKGLGMNIFCSYYELDGPRLSLNTKLVELDSIAYKDPLRKSPSLRHLINNTVQCFVVILYRAWNLPTYANRLLKKLNVPKA